MATSNVVVIIRSDFLTKFVRSPTGPVARDLVRRSRAVVDRARSLCPVGSGGGPHLRDTIKADAPHSRPDGIGIRIRATARHALWVHEGTAPHAIDPVHKTVLRFIPAGGGVVFARHVNHPGTKGQPFLRNALSAARR